MEITSLNQLPFDGSTVTPRALLTSAKSSTPVSEAGLPGAAVPASEFADFEALLSSPSGASDKSASSNSTLSTTASSTTNLGFAEQYAHLSQEATGGSDKLKEAFQDFVGQTFFAEMIKACRSSQQPSAYFHGGRAEEIFQGQLDQVLAEELSESSASKIADPMFDLLMLKRQT